ncbi:Type I phosphodiesterase / nucleotide pyrophosphatase [Planctomycetes bacterium Pan216]|uniref:Type I phosphodiesterase / nucleotide pyrophosphatase n=1 Tax=Kolteria novifilia TaxID=2527975 RepID=A0A518B4W5_9BACT|nr:Type I phosphodiesterase / nucleotide pyrophosphatase [Planctomycetes bacterium Pan216]
MKNVILVVIDAFASDIARIGFEQERLPMLKTLADRGAIRDSIAVFPSITPAATASLVTGCFPADHHVAGMHWIDVARSDVAYFGDDKWTILQKGVDTFLNEFLVDLNYERLHVPALFELIERKGFEAASLNYLWFRGDTTHRVHEPWAIKLIPGVSLEGTICGPRVLHLGDLVSSFEGVDLTSNGGPLERMGFNDRRTRDALLHLVERGLPAFTLAYFPDNDFDSHDDGPREALATLEKVDRSLAEVIDASGGLDRFLAETTMIVTGDHSQSELVEDASERGIDVHELLTGFKVGRRGDYWTEDDELVACPNLRAMQLYERSSGGPPTRQVVERLLSDPRVDQVIRRLDHASGSPTTYQVSTADRGEMSLRKAADSADAIADDHGVRWELEGDLAAIDATVSDRAIHFGDYPNALQRIAGAFSEVSGSLWVTAKPGHEFRFSGGSLHSRGSHGSLHLGDSVSPLIVAGGPEELQVPSVPRSVDVARLCMDALDLR